MTPPRVLVVSADDFGLTDGVCRGILRAGRDGVVTSASALVVGPAFARHASALRDSGLGVGLHLAVVGEDPPLLSAREVPTLVDGQGRLDPTWRRFVARASRGAVDRDDVAREAAAQHEALVATGIAATHADAHQNLHLWPLVGSVLEDLCRREGIRGMRLPRTRRVGPTALGVRALGVRLARRARRADLAVPGAAAGLDEAGGWDVAALVDAITRLGRSGATSAEIATHPGDDPDPDRSRYAWGYRWADEAAALCHPDVVAAVGASGMRPGTFADLAATR